MWPVPIIKIHEQSDFPGYLYMQEIISKKFSEHLVLRTSNSWWFLLLHEGSCCLVMQPFLWQHHTILKQIHDVFNSSQYFTSNLQQEFEKYLLKKSMCWRCASKTGSSSTMRKPAAPLHKNWCKICMCLWFLWVCWPSDIYVGLKELYKYLSDIKVETPTAVFKARLDKALSNVV